MRLKTSLKLKQNNLIRYSPNELALFELIPSDGSKIDTQRLTELFYKKQSKKIPLHGRVIVNGTVKVLIKKAKENKEPFEIFHSGRDGPRSAEVWVEY